MRGGERVGGARAPVAGALPRRAAWSAARRRSPPEPRPRLPSSAAKLRAAAACSPSLPSSETGRPTTTSSAPCSRAIRATSPGSGGSTTPSGRAIVSLGSQIADPARALPWSIARIRIRAGAYPPELPGFSSTPREGIRAVRLSAAGPTLRARADRLGRRLQRLVEPLRLAAAGLRDVVAAAAPAADDRCRLANDRGCGNPSEIAPGLATATSATFSPSAPPRTTAASPSFDLTRSARSSSSRWSVPPARAATTLIPPTSSAALAKTSAASPASLRPSLGDLRLELGEPLGGAARRAERVLRRAEQGAGLRELVALAAEPVDRGRAGERLDPAHVGRARALGDDREDPDLGRVGDVGAAAELARDVRRPRPPAPSRRTSRRTAPSRRAPRPRRAPSPSRAPGGSP